MKKNNALDKTKIESPQQKKRDKRIPCCHRSGIRRANGFGRKNRRVRSGEISQIKLSGPIPHTEVAVGGRGGNSGISSH